MVGRIAIDDICVTDQEETALSGVTRESLMPKWAADMWITDEGASCDE
jgi:hypothetical protein